MLFVEVLIDLPLQEQDTIFTYHVPPVGEGQVELGRRVLVKLGRRKVEGLIIDADAAPWPGSQPIIKVLDEAAVIDQAALALARWMAEYYCCSLYTAIKAMIPRRLNQKTGRSVIPLIDDSDLHELAELEGDPRSLEFMLELQEHGELSYKKAREFLGEDELNKLENQGLIHCGGSYSGYRALRNSVQKTKETILPAYSLSRDQARACRAVETALDRQAMAEYLIYGITGSGKTEVYIRTVESALRRGKSALVLIPEIALTRHLVEIFSERIPHLAVIHSRMTPGERHEEWKRIRSGEAKLVLGTRSAVFAPLSDLGLIIIDEEQEHSYKQQEQPRYHAREVARQRARQSSAVLLLGSATPSFESFNEAVNRRIGLLRMPERVGAAVLPEVFIADMRKGKTGAISTLLRDKIGGMLSRGEQTILFQNRRGFSPLTLCLDCGHIPGCPHCSVALTYHREPEREICHYCNYQTRVITTCPGCGGHRLQHMGTGTQKVEAEVRELFPQARVARLDLDSSQRKDAQPGILAGMKNGDIDILIGTQMVARGLDFPGVSLVGILDVDNMLNLPDFRAAERCFQLIVQAAGRAGRRDRGGEVVIQTFNPEHPVVQMAQRQDYEGFFREEISGRRLLKYPPFTHLLRIVLASEEEDVVRRRAEEVCQEIFELGDAKEDDFVILGPAPCPLYYIKNRFRYQLIVKCDNILLLSSIGKAVLTRGNRPGVKLQVEIDPLTSM